MALWLKRGIRSRGGQRIWIIWKISSGNILKRCPLKKQLDPLGTNCFSREVRNSPVKYVDQKKKGPPDGIIWIRACSGGHTFGIDLYIHVRIHRISNMGRLNYICYVPLLSTFEGSVIPDYLFSGTLPWFLVYGNVHIRYDHIHGNKSVVTSIPI